jgi:hypothetical protein
MYHKKKKRMGVARSLAGLLGKKKRSNEFPKRKQENSVKNNVINQKLHNKEICNFVIEF